jgi:ubiquitin carboxyl-terminal hydrolase 14
MVKVAVKWAKETYNVEVDPQEPGLVFKHQLFSLTGVPPERQKIMVKGGMLKDDADVAKLGLKEGQKLMMMGSADKVHRAGGPTIMLAVRRDFAAQGSCALSIPM